MTDASIATAPDAPLGSVLSDMVEKHGSDLYGGEPVTQLQHALQCAQLAENEGASPALITAALLHDVGHLLEDDFDDAPAHDQDRRHEELGDAFLSKWFGPDVTEPVRLHVAAKRYLCAVEPGYFDALSPMSRHSLMLQGGPMSEAEVAEFEANPYCKDAVRLRRWDDRGKDPNTKTATLGYYLSYALRCVRLNGANRSHA
jgi:phosphonate degradation associated HDIG domain protein